MPKRLSKIIPMILFCLFLGQSSYTLGQNLCQNALRPIQKPIASTLVELANSGHLLMQTSPILQRYPQYQLLVKDGGLCASTCGINGILAAMEHLGLDDIWMGTEVSRFSPAHLSRMMVQVTHSAELLNVPDPRRGLNFENLKKIMDDILALSRIGDIVSVLYGPSDLPYRGFWESNLSVKNDDLLFLAVTTRPGKGHAIILVEVDKTLKIIHYIDPNKPDKIFSAPYEVRKIDEYEGIYIRWSPELKYGADYGWVVDQLRVQTKSLTDYPFLHFKLWEGITDTAITLIDGSIVDADEISKVAWKEQNPYLEYLNWSDQSDDPKKMRIPLSQIGSIKKNSK